MFNYLKFDKLNDNSYIADQNNDIIRVFYLNNKWFIAINGAVMARTDAIKPTCFSEVGDMLDFAFRVYLNFNDKSFKINNIRLLKDYEHLRKPSKFKNNNITGANICYLNRTKK